MVLGDEGLTGVDALCPKDKPKMPEFEHAELAEEALAGMSFAQRKL